MSGAKKFKSVMNLSTSFWNSLAIYLSLNYLLQSYIAISLIIQIATIMIPFQYGTHYVLILSFLEVITFLFSHLSHHLSLINHTDNICLIIFIAVINTIIKSTENHKKTTKKNKNNHAKNLTTLSADKTATKNKNLYQNIDKSLIDRRTLE